MKTSGTTDVVLPLSKKQKCACNIVMGCLLVAAGVVLVLAGTGVIKAAVRDIAAPTVLFGFGAAVLLSAIIAKNSLSMWFAGVVLSCGLVSLLAVTTPAGYTQLYPIYIAAPAIGCLFSLWFAQSKLPQIKAILFFGGVGGILALGSSGACGYGLVGGLLAAFGGLVVIAIAVEAYLKKDKSDNA
ncbi:MAG: hypothetical protein K2M89_00560 [Clostridiales bacterium]|nr:hypothetical protein [Clostridiales bacterium]